jgi:hypothetical protein
VGTVRAPYGAHALPFGEVATAVAVIARWLDGLTGLHINRHKMRKSRAMTDQEIRDQVEKNYEAFQALLPTIIPLHQDKYALMKDGIAVGFYSTLEDAYMTATHFYRDQPFSVQKVTVTPVDLGFFSHAVPSR